MKVKQELERTIRLPQAVALYIGAVMGSGILLVPGMSAEMAGPASLLAWGAMVIWMLPMALVMGWLAAAYPHAGGVAHYVSRAFGEKAGVYAGWFFLMSVVIGAPVAALTGAGYLSAALGWGNFEVIILGTAILLIGLTVNYRGMKLSGRIQVTIIVGIVAVLLLAIIGSVPHIESRNFTPFMPAGWISVGQAASILFWCFIGWEAVSHLSEEFVNPKRDSVRGVIIASTVVGLLYFLTAFATVGTKSYGTEMGSDVALVKVINQMFGWGGSILAGATSFLICSATVIAYVGAASRLAYAIARDGNAPSALARLSKKYATPVGGLTFLAVCFLMIITLYGAGWISLTTLIQLPNATFILTYLAGCAAGVRLLANSRWGFRISWISLILTAAVFPFTGWAIVYPAMIALFVWLSYRYSKSKNPNRAAVAASCKKDMKMERT
ncbi:APC family permease [Paenactinomyces guangxiensis]|uniref:Amino acid permease n=1 Tax=Paenactinomyces guangxiensis TaxID=1490290 RepID=A0A7W1WTT2_9BACL|nr:amino acid permease [Paenactinomyces guangxiensis]MBA4495731.1 amino acid permease [Paenactinomyces guangxiensis]MBH8592720.1 amino acid permease [Paenactinomyces guangxiensis]